MVCVSQLNGWILQQGYRLEAGCKGELTTHTSESVSALKLQEAASGSSYTNFLLSSPLFCLKNEAMCKKTRLGFVM